MKIPNKIKIGNLFYKVTMEDDETFESCGKGSLLKQYLKLNSSMSAEMQLETLLHEIIHQILLQRSFKDETKDEKLIDVLAGGMYQIMIENGWLRPDEDEVLADSYTKGIADGYEQGFNQAQALNAKSNEMVTKILNTQSTTAHSGQGSSVYHNEDRHAIVKRPANKPQRAKGNPRRN